MGGVAPELVGDGGQAAGIRRHQAEDAAWPKSGGGGPDESGGGGGLEMFHHVGAEYSVEFVRVGREKFERIGDFGPEPGGASGLDGGRLNIAASALGGAQSALDKTLAYMGEREAFGKTIDQFQALQFRLADMETEMQAARIFLRQAASKLDRKALRAEVLG